MPCLGADLLDGDPVEAVPLERPERDLLDPPTRLLALLGPGQHVPAEPAEFGRRPEPDVRGTQIRWRSTERTWQPARQGSSRHPAGARVRIMAPSYPTPCRLAAVVAAADA